MTRVGWLSVAVGLVGVFVLSAAIGGMVARQMRGPPAAPPVAVASPTAAPIVTPTPVPSTAPSAVSTPSPQVTASPAATPSAEPPTPAPTPSPVPTVALDQPTAEDFADDLAAAIRDGDNAYLHARLHPATIERYGAQACRRHVNRNISGANVTWEIQGSSGPEAWDYVTDGITTTITDAWTVSVRQPGEDPELRDLHFAPSDGTWRWFTDCTAA